MNDMRDLYQEIILDHYKKPRNFHPITDASKKADGHNPLCGDRVTVYLKVDNDRVADVAFQGSGCAIFTASASMMTESLKGKTKDEIRTLFEAFHNLVTGKENEGGSSDRLGKLAAFSGVREFPVRVKCASLPWHTLRAALEGQPIQSGDVISTE